MNLPKSAAEPGSTASPNPQPRLDPDIGQAGVDLVIEPVDDIGGRAPGRADAAPAACLIARHIFAGRNVRQRRRAARGRHRQRPQPAGFDVFDRRRQAIEGGLHLAAQQVGQHRPGAAIRHVNHVDAGHLLEQFARQMGPGPGPGRCHVELAGIGLG